MKERRQYVRLPLTLNLSYMLPQEKENIYKSVSKDISPMGIRIGAAIELKPGQRLKLKLDLPGAPEPIEVNAKVAWTRKSPASAAPGFESGMRFISFPDETHKDIFFGYIADALAKQKPNF